jgi:N-acetylglucosamine kinase-like BadF-type ATPase
VAYTIEIVREVYERALRDAGLQIGKIDMITGGLTGADWPEEYEMLRNALIVAGGVSDVAVYNDCIVAFGGSIGRRFGAVICMGSALNVGIVSSRGEIEALGWYIDEDSAGSCALGGRAIRAAIASDVGVAAPTALTAHILRAFNLISVEELLRRKVSGTLPDIRTLAPCVFDAASEGDAAAIEIILDCANWAANYAVAMLRRRSMLDMEVDVVLSGSVLKNKNRLMRDHIASVINAACPAARVIDAVYEPVVGAAVMTLERKFARSLDERTAANIHASCVKLGLLR